MYLLNKYREWKFKRHIKKFGHKNIGYFNYFNKEWFERHQKILIWLLNHWLLKYWFRWVLRIHKDCSFNEYIDKIEPHSYRVALGNNIYRSDFRTHNKFSKRIYYAFRPFWWALHILDYIIQRTIALQFSFGFDTLTVYPDADPETTTGDGFFEVYSIRRYYEIFWYNATSVNNSSNIAYIGLTEDNSGFGYYSYMSGLGLTFDTSSIEQNYILNSQNIYVYLISLSYSGDGDLADSEVLGSCPWNPSVTKDFVLSDWKTVNTSLTESYDTFLSIGSPFQYCFWALNSNRITKGGITKLFIRGSYNNWVSGSDYYNLGLYTADFTGVDNDPKLVINYTMPSNFVPQVINII